MFIAALFTVAKTWKQPKRSLTDERIKRTWYIYIMEYCLAIKKKEIISFAALWMDLESITLNEVSQLKTNIMCCCLHVESKKNDPNELIYKTEIDTQT